MPVISGRIIVSHQSAKKPTGATGAMVPQQQSAISQLPSAFVHLRRQRQIFTVRECPRCEKPVIPQNALFCAGCGLPLFGCPCPSCQSVLEYYPDHLNPKSELFWCPYCGAELEWCQKGGGPAYLETY